MPWVLLFDPVYEVLEVVTVPFIPEPFHDIYPVTGFSFAVFRELVVAAFTLTQEMGADEFQVFIIYMDLPTALAVIRNGKVEYQLIGDKGFDKYDAEFDGHSVHMESKTWKEGNKASVFIDGTERAINHRGINVVVFSNTRDEVIDSVAFDTHDPEFPCYR